MAFKIYTKTGDKGKTSLYGGKRIAKSDIRIESYGTVDELNSYIGLIRASLNSELLVSQLSEIQDRLFTTGSILASDPDKEMPSPDLLEADITFLEKAMDQMDESLPALTSFILPGADVLSAHVHVARCICRRAERRVIALNADEKLPEIVIIYLNRLSDYLFMLSRTISNNNGSDEIPWLPRKKS
jgi:cob(I)alamin adenosyltransferase